MEKLINEFNDKIDLIKEKNEILKSLSKDYKNNFNHKNLKKFKKSLDFRVIGMGGSSLGAMSIS